MFFYLYEKYMDEVRDGQIWMYDKKSKLFDKTFIVFIIFGGIIYFIDMFIRNEIVASVIVGLVIIGFFTMPLYFGRKRKKRILNEKIGPSAIERMKNVVCLLQEFGIDISKEEQLNHLIEQAKKTQADYDVWKMYKRPFGGMATYVLLPTFTIILSELLKGEEPSLLFKRAIPLVFICFLFVLLMPFYATVFNEIINPDIRHLNEFIDDITDVKIFSDKAKGLLEK